MTEKLSINLTEGDVDVKPAHGADPTLPLVINYVMRCPLCETEFWLTRIGSNVCDCNITWTVDVIVRGKRAYEDEDKFQAKMDFEMSGARGTTEKPETPEFETTT